MNCELCAAQTESHRIIYKTNTVIVFVNLKPVKNGHIMIMPLRHVENLCDLNAEEAVAFTKTIDRCMNAISNSFDEGPVCCINGGKWKTQAHLHAHVLPCKNSLRTMFATMENLEKRKEADRETLSKMADTFRPFFQS